MDTRKKGGYKYSQSEKEALRVLKMQEQDLESLGNDTSSQTDELGELRKRVEKLSATLGVASKPKADDAEVPRTTLNIPVSDIPSWESMVERAGNEVPADVSFENLLTEEEFDYCIEDVGRINEGYVGRDVIAGAFNQTFPGRNVADGDVQRGPGHFRILRFGF